MSELKPTVEFIYRHFRDFLGFILPGTIVLISVILKFINIQKFYFYLTHTPSWMVLIFWLLSSYLIGLIIHGVFILIELLLCFKFKGYRPEQLLKFNRITKDFEKEGRERLVALTRGLLT